MKFTHIRNVGGEIVLEQTDADGNVIKEQYIRGGGNITVAYEHDQEKDFEGQKTITAAFAFCSPSDVFIKVKGRGIATGRFLKGDTHTINVVNESELSDSKGPIIESALAFLVDSTSPMTLLMRNDFDDSLLAPRWIQSDIVNQFAYEMQSRNAEAGGCCDDPDCENPDCDEPEVEAALKEQ